MDKENAIEVKNITKDFKVYYDKGSELKEKMLFWKRNKYEKRHVLKGISFTVKKGEAIGLVGKNGCGKSTTLKMLTAESAEDIVKYVNELKGDIEVLATSMEETTSKLSEGNEKVEISLRDIEHMNEQMTAINDAVERIFDDIDRQSETTKEFNDQVSNIADTYGMLTNECTETGTHIFKIGRYIDTCRSDMFREAGAVTTQDMLRIFEIDHFILMWRVYNNIVDFERLKITQLNNPDTCKIGKWMHSQTDTRITTSSQFKKLDAAHRLIHKYACESWYAKDEGDINKALEAFQKCYDAYYEYKKAIADMKSYMRTIGYTDETKIVIFRN